MSSPRNICIILAAGLILIICIWQPAQAAWSTNPSENTPVCDLSDNQDDPQMVSDGAGGMIVVWRDNRISGTESDIFISRLDASGYPLWAPNGLALNIQANHQLAPVLVEDGAGGAVIAWQDYRSGASEIYAQRMDGTDGIQWNGSGVPICTQDSGASPWQPQLTTDGAGGAIITWMDSRNGNWDIYAQRVDASGNVQWTVDGVPVCTAAYEQENPVIVSDGNNGAIIAWTDLRQGDNYQVYLQRLDASGATLWTAGGVGVGSPTPDDQFPDLLADDDLGGGARVTWTEERYAGHDIFAQWIDGSGNPIWTAGGIAVCAASDTQDRPRLASDGQDGIIVAWEDERSGTGVDLYAQRIDPYGTALWAIDGVAVCTETGNQLLPQLTSDDAGGALLAWVDFRSGTNYDVYAQRIDQWGFLLWPTEGSLISMAPSHQLDPVLLPDGDGGTFIAWDDQRSGTGYDVYAQHVDWKGRRAGASWSIDPNVNNPVCLAEDNQSSTFSTSDGLGGIVLSWNHDFPYPSQDQHLYVQRVDSNGSPAWDADGVAVCTTSGYKSAGLPVSDGAGGTITTWSDLRNGSYYKLHTQRIDASGNILWAADGLPVCPTDRDQELGWPTSDGAGGAILVWSDDRSAIRDLYAQRVDASGNMLWATNGVIVCNASDYQGTARAVSDGEGGAIIFWVDLRARPDRHIYAQRIDASGNTLWVSNGVNLLSSGDFTGYNIEAVSDGLGGAIVAWGDSRGGVSADIYAQRLNSAGDQLWGTDGMAVCLDPALQEYPRLASDGMGGAFITWSDRRTGDYNDDIYGQYITAAGHAHWMQDGIAVCTAAGVQSIPSAMSDGTGGVIISWTNYAYEYERTDIYAQRIDMSGNALWQHNGRPITTAPGDQHCYEPHTDGNGGLLAILKDNRLTADDNNNDIYAQNIDGNGYTGEPEPVISGVIDHPGDQGGVTVLSWAASPYDQFPGQVVTHYSVWMHLPDREGQSDQSDQSYESLGDLERTGWVEVDDVTATYQDDYAYHTSTYEDWTGGPDFPLTEYKVIAHTADPWVFWESEVRSGCSVDNLAPGAPITLFGLPDETDVLLTWEASGDDDEDLAHYNIYRGSSPGFTADENTLIGTVIDIEYTDPNPGHGTWYYRVAGEDVHGNVGTASNEAAVPVSTATVAASLTCTPSSGTLPFVCGFNVQLTNQYQGQVRRIAGRIHVTLANGTSYGNWRAGSTNVQPGSTYVTSWNQPLPALAPLVGDNQFRLVAADVTPAPYNQPPYPPDGDTDSDTATVTGIAP